MSDRSVRAGDPFAYAGQTKAKRNGEQPPTRTTRRYRCTEEFVQLLAEDFGIPEFALNMAFMGVPAEPKKGAIALCEWAAGTDDPARALLSWARKNGRGTFCPDVAGGEDDEDEA